MKLRLEGMFMVVGFCDTIFECQSDDVMRHYDHTSNHIMRHYDHTSNHSFSICMGQE